MNRRDAALILLAIAVAVGIVLTVARLGATRHKVAALRETPVDMTAVRDGVYRGACDGGLIQVEAEVRVAGRRIVSVRLLRHDNGRGTAAEALLARMAEQNTDAVDTVAGATLSSRCIRHAVNSALLSGLRP